MAYAWTTCVTAVAMLGGYLLGDNGASTGETLVAFVFVILFVNSAVMVGD